MCYVLLFLSIKPPIIERIPLLIDHAYTRFMWSWRTTAWIESHNRTRAQGLFVERHSVRAADTGARLRSSLQLFQFCQGHSQLGTLRECVMEIFSATTPFTGATLVRGLVVLTRSARRATRCHPRHRTKSKDQMMIPTTTAWCASRPTATCATLSRSKSRSKCCGGASDRNATNSRVFIRKSSSWPTCSTRTLCN